MSKPITDLPQYFLNDPVNSSRFFWCRHLQWLIYFPPITDSRLKMDESSDESLRLLESISLRYGWISRPLNSTDGTGFDFKRKIIIFLNSILAVRSLILISPKYYSGTSSVSLILGDFISSLGFPVLQAWYVFFIGYSFFANFVLISLARDERLNKLKCMTDFAPSQSSKSGLNSTQLRKLKIALFLYRSVHLMLNSTVFFTMIMSLTLEYMNYRNSIRLAISTCWAICNMIYSIIVATLIHLCLYVWLSAQVVENKINEWESMCQQLLEKSSSSTNTPNVSQIIGALNDAFSKVSDYNMTIRDIIETAYFVLMFTSAAALMILFATTGLHPIVYGILFIQSLGQVMSIMSVLYLAAGPFRSSHRITFLLYTITSSTVVSRSQRQQILRLIKAKANKRQPLGFTCGQHFPVTSATLFHFLYEVSLYVILFLSTMINWSAKSTRRQRIWKGICEENLQMRVQNDTVYPLMPIFY